MSKKSSRVDLFVATVFNGKGRESNAGWARKNGDPQNLHTGSKRLKSIGKKQGELIAQVLAVNAALRDMKAGTHANLHIENQLIVDILNSEKITPLLVKARRCDAKNLATAAHGLADEIARHSDAGQSNVRGIFHSSSNDNESDEPQSYMSIAYEKAAAVNKERKPEKHRDRNGGPRGLHHQDGLS